MLTEAQGLIPPGRDQMLKVTCRDTGHRVSATICSAFAEGCDANIEPVDAGFMVPRGKKKIPAERSAREDEVTFLYGNLRGGMEVYLDRVHLGLPFLYCDNGYLRPGQFDGYYRVTWNRRFHIGSGAPDYRRLECLDIKIRPWRKSGNHIIVCPPVRDYDRAWFFNGDYWVKHVHKQIARATSRKISIRWRDDDPRRLKDQPTLKQDLATAWALVTHESGVAIEALVAGVPVFLTGEGAARSMGRSDIHCIERPIYPDNRREWLGVLAANQWTLDEFRDGTAARALGLERG